MSHLRYLLLASISVFLVGTSNAQTIDLSRDFNHLGRDVTTVVVSVNPKNLSIVGIADTTGYGEFYFGKSISVGNFSFTPYMGAEWLKGVPPTTRGMLVTTWRNGPWSALNVIEFAGNTGNFNKQFFGYTTGSLTLNVMNHSVAGRGGRADWKNQNITLYFSISRRVMVTRLTTGITFDF